MAFDYKTRLPNQFEGAENLRALIDVAAEMFEETNEILRTLRDDETIDLADGVWLDEIGDIVGAARGAGQVSDDFIFTYKSALDEDAPDKSFYDDMSGRGGYYIGVDGLPDGTVFIDDDYRLLIRAKVAATYSGDTIPEIWTWINTVFETDAFVYTAAPGAIGVDLDEYLTSTQRRILINFAPRPAGVSLDIIHFATED